jgi:hypothetical protein
MGWLSGKNSKAYASINHGATTDLARREKLAKRQGVKPSAKELRAMTKANKAWHNGDLN